MGRHHGRFDARGHGCARKIQSVVQRLRAIIYARQKMAVKVDHKDLGRFGVITSVIVLRIAGIGAVITIGLLEVELIENHSEQRGIGAL